MTDRSPQPEANGTVTVRLSEIDRDLRMRVADEIVRRGKLRGIAAADLMLVAFTAVPDAKLPVPREKADRVLVEGKQPLGPSLEVWKW